MLKDVVQAADGTGTAAQAAHRPAAGKTGTAEDDKAAWFAGYTPDLVTVVAVMGQNSDTGSQQPLYGATGLGRVNGGGYPAQIWAAYTAAALRGRPARDFDLSLERGAPAAPSAAPTAVGGPDTGPGDTPPTTDPTGPPAAIPPTDPAGPGDSDDGGLIGGPDGGTSSDGGTDGGPDGTGDATDGGTGGMGGNPTRSVNRGGRRPQRYNPVESSDPNNRSAATACRSRSRINT